MTASVRPVIVDDIHEAIARLTPLGAAVVRPAAGSIRNAVMLFAATHDWRVVEHRSFAAWLTAQVDPDYVWLVLDPLLDCATLGVEAHPLRLSRTVENNQWVIKAGLPEEIREVIRGRDVGVIDDVVSSGLTLRHLTRIVSEAGGTIADVAVCTSTAAGRASVLDGHPELSWTQFVPGDHDAIHLRDGCPLVAFGGRKVAKGMPVQATLRRVEPAYSPTAFPGLWSEIGRDRFVSERIVAARKLVAERLSSSLGRPATIDDVPLVGDAVGYPHYRSIPVTAETRITELIG